MTDNEIIKALECCVSNRQMHCNGCPLYYFSDDCIVCVSEAIKNALDLINRQKAEIERLKKVLNGRDQLINALNKCYKQAKSEAVKEFAERLKETIINAINTYYNSNGGGYYLAEDVIEDIDNLVKEMTEVNENEKHFCKS